MVGWGGQHIRTQLLQDRFENALGLEQYLTIVEAKHPYLSALKRVCPGCITSTSIVGEVLAAVNLNHESMLRAQEVEDERSELVLPARLRSANLSSPEHHPKETLCVSLLTPECAASVEERRS
jgi:hypothetical protein